MRDTARKTTLSELRRVADLSQGQLAEMVGKSVHTIRSIEQGKHPLSNELAFRIARETGVSMHWLLHGNPNIGPQLGYEDPMAVKKEQHGLSRYLGDYQKSDFERVRSKIEAGETPFTIHNVEAPPAVQLTAILESARSRNQGDLAAYKINRFLEELESEFGSNDLAVSEGLEQLRLWRGFEVIFENPYQERWGGYKDPEPQAIRHKELIPSLARDLKSLRAEYKKRVKEAAKPQKPGLLPLLEWTVKAVTFQRKSFRRFAVNLLEERRSTLKILQAKELSQGFEPGKLTHLPKGTDIDEWVNGMIKEVFPPKKPKAQTTPTLKGRRPE